MLSFDTADVMTLITPLSTQPWSPWIVHGEWALTNLKKCTDLFYISRFPYKQAWVKYNDLIWSLPEVRSLQTHLGNKPSTHSQLSTTSDILRYSQTQHLKLVTI